MDEVIVEILGCGDAFASGGSFNTWCYVQSPSYGVFIDWGDTFLLAFKKKKVSHPAIDLIAISQFQG